eukprot:5589454-Pyramimonas_sp.AAC.1
MSKDEEVRAHGFFVARDETGESILAWMGLSEFMFYMNDGAASYVSCASPGGGKVQPREGGGNHFIF